MIEVQLHHHALEIEDNPFSLLRLSPLNLLHTRQHAAIKADLPKPSDYHLREAVIPIPLRRIALQKCLKMSESLFCTSDLHDTFGQETNGENDSKSLLN